MESVPHSRPSPGVALPPFSDDEGSTTPKPGCSSKAEWHESLSLTKQNKPATSVRESTILSGTSETPHSQETTSGMSHGQPPKTDLPEPNYELIHSLASALCRHMKKNNLTAEKSKDFMAKCVAEIIHICEVCIRKEARRKEAEGRVKAGSVRLDGTMARDEGVDGVQDNINTNRDQDIPQAVTPGRNDTSGVFLIEPHISTTKEEVIDNEHCLQFVGNPFPKTVPVTPPPIGSGLLSRRFEMMKLDQSAEDLLYKPEILSQKLDLRSQPRHSFESVQKINTGIQCFVLPETKAFLIPDTSTETHISCNIHQPVPNGTLVRVCEETPCIRSWQWKMPLSNFDLYRPITMTYPGDEFLFEGSPVFYHEASLKHRTARTVWKNLSFLNSQEVFRWVKIFCETLTMTLEILKKQTANTQRIAATSRKFSELGSQSDSETEVLWTDYEWPISYFIEEMKNRYTEQYGLPQYLITDEELICFLGTRETIRSMSAKNYQVTDEDRLLGKYSEPTFLASLGFTSKSMVQDVRRFTPLICNSSPHEWYMATAGDEFVFVPTLWDPHHPYAEVETTTTYTLEPKVPWLTWNHTRRAFVGVPPRKMRLQFDAGHGIMSRKSYVENTEDEDLDLTVVAFSFLTLPQGVQYERTIKASTTIHIHPSRQAIQAESAQYRESSSKDQIGTKEREISPEGNDLVKRQAADVKAGKPLVTGIVTTKLEHTVGFSAGGSEGDNKTSNKHRVQDITKSTTSTTNTTSQKDTKHQLNDPMHVVEEPMDDFPIVGDIESTWDVENATLVPSRKYPLWTRQRAFIEHCVTLRGKKMIGMFGRQEKYDSDSSETDLSDAESRYLKHIPFITSYRQESQPAWKATVNEDEPLFKPRFTASHVHNPQNNPCVHSEKIHTDAQGEYIDGVSATVDEGIEDIIPITMELSHRPTAMDATPTGLALTLASTISPTPIRVQPNLASTLEASTSENGFTRKLSNESTDTIVSDWPSDLGERSILLAELGDSDSETECMGQGVELRGAGSDQVNGRPTQTQWGPNHGVTDAMPLKCEPWSPID